MFRLVLNRFPRVFQANRKPRASRLQVRPTLETLESRYTPSSCSPTTLIVDNGLNPPTNSYSTIQAAINQATTIDTAHPGTTVHIEIYGGTYAGQLLVPSTDSNLCLLQYNSSPVTIAAPATLAPPHTYYTGSVQDAADVDTAVLEISGAQNVYVTGLTIAGNTLTQFGIKVDQAGEAIIQNCNVTAVLGGTDAAAILIGRDDPSAPGDVTSGTGYVINDCISNYSKAGVVVDNTGSYGLISCDTITGGGSSYTNFQYGVQVSRGAQGDVRGNTVTANAYSTSGTYSAGILVGFNASPLTNVNNNNLHGNGSGIFLEETSSVTVECNNSYSNVLDGITIVDTRCSEIDSNDVDHNGQYGISVYGSDPYIDNYNVIVPINVPTGGNNDIYWNCSYSNAQDGFYMNYQNVTPVNANNFVAYNDSLNNGGNGFNYISASQNLVWQNFASGNQLSGMAVTTTSDNNLFLANGSNCNVVYGFSFTGTSSNNLVICNTADNNGNYGFFESTNSVNTFIGNAAYGNGANGRLNFTADITQANCCFYQSFVCSYGISNNCGSDLNLFGGYC
jgi:hypothetical protein